eukprot:TRINITY_DN6135_c0_g3_i2.p1 TRINITY_DN6135_c0_g3~~TRINITY_DN6135_c0_g3_i2.p1  ORF type:complete len:406 (+),score=88.35 TRINITY_DN6135_c0_g3_i2:71-1288(+)
MCIRVFIFCAAVAWGTKVFPDDHADQPAFLAPSPEELLLVEKPDVSSEISEKSPFEHAHYLLLVLAAGMIMLFTGSLGCKALAFSLCAVYIAFSVTIDLGIKMLSEQSSGNKQEEKEPVLASGYTFNPVCMVVIVEASKLLTSCILCMISFCTQPAEEKPIFERSLNMRAQVAWFALPATIFTLNNVLVFKAVGSNDTAVFGVVRDTMILWTAALWKGVFGENLGYHRSAAIVIIFAGLLVNQLSRHLTGNFSMAVAWILLMTLCNASGSVSNEYVLKQAKDMDINLQNTILYAWCILASFVILLATDPSRLSSAHAFFSGFTWLAWLLSGVQACGGLLVSRMLKYTDSVMKTAANCLRGPVLVVIAPFFVKSYLDNGSLASTLLVALGCFLYLAQGPLSSDATK